MILNFLRITCFHFRNFLKNFSKKFFVELKRNWYDFERFDDKSFTSSSFSFELFLFVFKSLRERRRNEYLKLSFCWRMNDSLKNRRDIDRLLLTLRDNDVLYVSMIFLNINFWSFLILINAILNSRLIFKRWLNSFYILNFLT